jgi:hypothetical protein
LKSGIVRFPFFAGGACHRLFAANFAATGCKSDLYTAYSVPSLSVFLIVVANAAIAAHRLYDDADLAPVAKYHIDACQYARYTKPQLDCAALDSIGDAP